jgi:hypothetical protein
LNPAVDLARTYPFFDPSADLGRPSLSGPISHVTARYPTLNLNFVAEGTNILEVPLAVRGALVDLLVEAG